MSTVSFEVQSFSASNNMLIRVHDQMIAVVGFAVCPGKDQTSERIIQPCIISDGKIVPFTSSDEFELVAVTPEQWVAVGKTWQFLTAELLLSITLKEP